MSSHSSGIPRDEISLVPTFVFPLLTRKQEKKNYVFISSRRSCDWGFARPFAVSRSGRSQRIEIPLITVHRSLLFLESKRARFSEL